MIKIPPRVLILLAVVAVLSGILSPAQSSTSPSENENLEFLFAQLPVDSTEASNPLKGNGMLRANYGEGCRIVRLDPDGMIHVLTEGFHSACEFDISFDGTRLLFAGKRKKNESWNIWEMGLDDLIPTQITREMGNCRSPRYQSTLYTIVSTAPWSQIMFTSDLAGFMNNYGSSRSSSLYSCRMDGTKLRRLTLNPGDDFDPFLMADGRVLLSSWQRPNLNRGYEGRISLFGVNTDGTDYALYSANRGFRIRHMACETGNGQVVFIQADEVPWDGSGPLAVLPVRRPFSLARPLDEDCNSLYHSPSPLSEKAILVSRRASDGSGSHALGCLNLDDGSFQVLFDDPVYHDFHGAVLRPRSRPDGRSSSVNEEIPTGKLYCLDVSLWEPALVHYGEKEMVKQVRVVEGLPISEKNRDAFLTEDQIVELGGLGGPGSTVYGMSPMLPRRLLGLVPVEDDGSFQIEIPADIPIELQALDESGMALQSCGWIWAKNREWRGCIGCHEDPELVPENRYVKAAQKPAVKLLLPPEKRRTVDFLHDVMPIVKKKCANCHDGREDRFDLTDSPAPPYNRAYRELMAQNLMTRGQGHPVRGKWVHPGSARTSPVIWIVSGESTKRPFDTTVETLQKVRLHSRWPDPLTDAEKLTFVEWIDLGAAWDARTPAREFKSDTAGEGR